MSLHKKNIAMAYAAYSPIVQSKGKSLYSFSKSSRFELTKPQSSMKYYNLKANIGKDKSKGSHICFGPKHSKVLIVRGLDKTPSPHKYTLPSSNSGICKTFGLQREKCVSVIHAGPRGDNIPDKIVPGPGTYDKRLMGNHKKTSS